MIYIFGGGGHCKSIIDILHSVYPEEELAILDDTEEKQGVLFYGVKVVGRIVDTPADFDGKAIIAIGINKARETISKRFPKVKWQTVIHPTAVISESAHISEGSAIMASAVIQSDVEIGVHVIVGIAATVSHDCKIADFVHICPGCNVTGRSTVGKYSFIGAGSVVIPDRIIGSNAIVGAGSCVISDLPDNTVSVGSPAKVIKTNV